jgi:hypothetical protein
MTPAKGLGDELILTMRFHSIEINFKFKLGIA